MAHPWNHARSSVNKWGGRPEDYLPIHRWFDESKAHHADFRHRALRHHAEGIFLMESIFGVTLNLSTCEKCGEVAAEGAHPLAIQSLENTFMEMGGRGVELADRIDALRQKKHLFTPKKVPTRLVGEQHVQEDLGCIPPATDWLKRIEPEPWMMRPRKLSTELEEKDVPEREESEVS